MHRALWRRRQRCCHLASVANLFDAQMCSVLFSPSTMPLKRGVFSVHCKYACFTLLSCTIVSLRLLAYDLTLTLLLKPSRLDLTPQVVSLCDLSLPAKNSPPPALASLHCAPTSKRYLTWFLPLVNNNSYPLNDWDHIYLHR